MSRFECDVEVKWRNQFVQLRGRLPLLIRAVKNLKNKQKECNNLDNSLRGASIAPSSRESVTYLVILASVNALTDKSCLLTCSGVSSTNIT